MSGTNKTANMHAKIKKDFTAIYQNFSILMAFETDPCQDDLVGKNRL